MPSSRPGRRMIKLVSPQDGGSLCVYIWRSHAPQGVLADSSKALLQWEYLFTSPVPFIKRYIDLLLVFTAAFTSCIETDHLEIWFKHSKSLEFFPQLLGEKKIV